MFISLVSPCFKPLMPERIKINYLKASLKVVETITSVALLALALLALFFSGTTTLAIYPIIGFVAIWLVANLASFCLPDFKFFSNQKTEDIENPPSPSKTETINKASPVKAQIEVNYAALIEEKIESAKQYVTSLQGIQNPEELMEDFDRVKEEEISDREKCQMLDMMFEGLPYYLKLEPYLFSEFPAIGIPNKSGYNCHFNAALQVMVHYRGCDFGLWKPLKKPQAPEALFPLPPEPEPPIKPDFDRYAYQAELLKDVVRKYGEDQERYENEKKEYRAKTYELEKLKGEHENFKEQMVIYESRLELARCMRTQVIRLRNGKKADFAALPHLPLGDHTWWLDEIGIKTVPLKDSKLTAEYLEENAVSVFILGGSGHYKVVVRKSKNEWLEIDDSRAKPIENSYKAIIDNRRYFHPYIIL